MKGERNAGYAVLGTGLGLLGYTFLLAYRVLVDPAVMENFRSLTPGAPDAVGFLIYLIPLGLLYIMASIGVRIVGHGLSLVKSEPR